MNIDYTRGDTCLNYTTPFEPINLTNNEEVTSWGWKFVNTGDSINTTKYNPSTSYKLTSVGKQEVYLTAYNDGCKIGDTTKFINVKDCKINPDNVFTPNGDAANDFWIIKGIEDYPNADIVIFNRWGIIVHHIPGTAMVPWDGKNDKGEDLEQGTYYFIITLNKVEGSNEIVKGYVTILRDIND